MYTYNMYPHKQHENCLRTHRQTCPHGHRSLVSCNGHSTGIVYDAVTQVLTRTCMFTNSKHSWPQLQHWPCWPSTLPMPQALHIQILHCTPFLRLPHYLQHTTNLSSMTAPIPSSMESDYCASLVHSVTMGVHLSVKHEL